MKFLIALLTLTINLHAESKPWVAKAISSPPSPVDELVIAAFPKVEFVKLSHPDVSTVKLYINTQQQKVVYAVWKWKPLGWQIMDASEWNAETKFAKGIPADFLDPLHLATQPVVDYGEKYKKSLPKIKKFTTKMVQSNAKGCQEFVHEGFSGEPNREAIKRFYMEHRVTAVIPIVYGDTARTDILLCYDDGLAPMQQNIPYEIENE